MAILYVLIAISALSVMGGDELAGQDGPLAAVMQQVGGSSWATFLIVVALFATSKTIMSNLLGSSRLLFDVARDSEISWLQRLTAVNEKTGTPIYAIIFITIGVIVLRCHWQPKTGGES